MANAATETKRSAVEVGVAYSRKKEKLYAANAAKSRCSCVSSVIEMCVALTAQMCVDLAAQMCVALAAQMCVVLTARIRVRYAPPNFL